jgi:hypothetical protein
VFHPQGAHKTRDYYKLEGFAHNCLSTKTQGDSSQKIEDLKDDFPVVNREVNYIFNGMDAYESKRKQKLTHREVMMANPGTPEFLRWSEMPIMFNRSDHLDCVPKLGRYPLIVSPTTECLLMEEVL